MRFSAMSRAIPFVVILCLGIFATKVVGNITEQAQRSALMDEAKIIAASIDAHDLARLSGTPRDMLSDDYVGLKEQMIKIHENAGNLRFVYLFGLRNTQIFFYVDSEPTTSEDYSAPGDIYSEVDPLVPEGFIRGVPFVVGPYTDRWGTWVSAYAPIFDSDSGVPLADIGLDIDATQWQENIWKQQVLPIVSTIFVLILFVLYHHHQKVRKEIDAMKSEFVSVASHQLRTPLTGIKWFCQLLLGEKAGKLLPDQKDFLEQISVSNERMIKLVEDLLNVSRIDTKHKFDIVKKPLNVVTLVQSVIDEHVPLCAKRTQMITFVPPKKFPMMDMDEQKIRQVIGNLVSNALKYSSVGSTVEVTLGMDEQKRAVITVSDHGIGIPLSSQKRMFQKFFRAENAVASETDGTGLGLYIAKSICEAHGGGLTFTSVEGKGTTFVAVC